MNEASLSPFWASIFSFCKMGLKYGLYLLSLSDKTYILASSRCSVNDRLCLASRLLEDALYWHYTLSPCEVPLRSEATAKQTLRTPEQFNRKQSIGIKGYLLSPPALTDCRRRRGSGGQKASFQIRGAGENRGRGLTFAGQSQVVYSLRCAIGPKTDP